MATRDFPDYSKICRRKDISKNHRVLRMDEAEVTAPPASCSAYVVSSCGARSDVGRFDGDVCVEEGSIYTCDCRTTLGYLLDATMCNRPSCFDIHT